MPGPQSDSFKGQRGNTPVVPTWMQDTCPKCDLLLDEDFCHHCETDTRTWHDKTGRAI